MKSIPLLTIYWNRKGNDMKIIKLNEYSGDGSIYIVVDKIVKLEKTRFNGYYATNITLLDGSTEAVEETPEEIEALANKL